MLANWMRAVARGVFGGRTGEPLAVSYRAPGEPRRAPSAVTVHIRRPAADEPQAFVAAARAWVERQTHDDIRLRVWHEGRLELSLPAAQQVEPASGWFLVLDGLPHWPAAAIENAWLAAASEAIDRIRIPARVFDHALAAGTPAIVLESAAAFRFDPAAFVSRPAAASAIEKRIRDPLAGERAEGSSPPWSYFSFDGERAVTIDLAEALLPTAATAVAPRILVLAPFLARGGAEHTLFETARLLAARGELEFAFATLAPHRSELGDRRADFAAISPRIASLGDLLHPDAMYGALLALVDSLAVRLVYNANGSTLFYDFAKRLRADRPSIPIVDHLYDHEVGYITWYDPATPSFVDLCVAENRRIANRLTAEGWPVERVPVVWPCGRPDSAFPPSGERDRVRRELRAELGIGESELLVLTAARAHPQKRPLDWVRLAERLTGTPVRFVWVGGGDLEGELDAAIAASPAKNLRRLPFRTDIPALLVAADLALLVSDFEGLPVFFLEAIQAGRPFVATDVGDIGDLARETGAGEVSGPPGDLAALEAAVRRMLDGESRVGFASRATAAAPSVGVEACARRYGEVLLRTMGPR